MPNTRISHASPCPYTHYPSVDDRTTGWGSELRHANLMCLRIHKVSLFASVLPPLRAQRHICGRLTFTSQNHQSLMLAYKVLNGTAPIYLSVLEKAYVTTRSLRSSQECRLAVPTPRLRQSKLFSCVVPRWWNDLPSATRTGASLSIFKKLLETQLFREHLLS